MELVSIKNRVNHESDVHNVLFCVRLAMPCDADLVPMGPEYSPHLHTSMALVLSIGVMGMMGMYSFYRRYRAKILPIPAIILGTLRSGDGIANAQFFPKEPKYEQEEN